MSDPHSTPRAEPAQGQDDPLSMLADGELDAREAGFVLRRLAGDSAARARWQRLHLMRASLRGELSGPAVSLVERVATALEDESAHVDGADSAAAGGWRRYALGGALAASVAVMAVVGLGERVGREAAVPSPGFVSQSTALDRQFSARATPVSLSDIPSPQRIAPPVPARESRLQSRQRIDQYVIRHGQLAGGQGLTGLTPVLTLPSDLQVVRPMVVVTEDARR
ncbi:MAG: RseA family anti-sigma factor [Wenzhouxiangellaceae bacterium]|nr:RseA family anti-sigma factor [Wenzhouxiangellaceae bacterium]